VDTDDIDPKVRTLIIQPYQWWDREEWEEYRFINSSHELPDEEADSRFIALEQAALRKARYLTNARLAGYNVTVDEDWPHHISFFDIDTKNLKEGIDE
jgi:hypothetical protein